MFKANSDESSTSLETSISLNGQRGKQPRNCSIATKVVAIKLKMKGSEHSDIVPKLDSFFCSSSSCQNFHFFSLTYPLTQKTDYTSLFSVTKHVQNHSEIANLFCTNERSLVNENQCWIPCCLYFHSMKLHPSDFFLQLTFSTINTTTAYNITRTHATVSGHYLEIQKRGWSV